VITKWHRIRRPDGILYLEDGHQPRALAKEKVRETGYWEVIAEAKAFIRCAPVRLLIP